MKHISIGGTCFCGSTILQFILGQIPRTIVIGELNNIFRNQCCSIHNQDCSFWTKKRIQKYLENKCLTSILKTVKETVLTEDLADILIDSDKAYKIYQKHGLLGEPSDLYIILYKHPESYMHSYYEHNRSRFKDNLQGAIVNAIKDYKYHYRGFLELNNHGYKCIFINYHLFTENPKQTISHLCDYINIQYSPEFLNYWKRKDNLHPIGGNTGVFLNLWDDKTSSRIIKSNYWKTVYTDEHTKRFQKKKFQIIQDKSYLKSENYQSYKSAFEYDKSLRNLFLTMDKKSGIL